MRTAITLVASLLFTCVSLASEDNQKDKAAIVQAAKNYIEAQRLVKPELLQASLDEQLIKRTYWQNKDGSPALLEMDKQGLIELSKTYNLKGDRFPQQPSFQVEVLDIDQRVASVKLTVDEWIDYMHLYKADDGQWKIINVLWQFHDVNRHKTK